MPCRIWACGNFGRQSTAAAAGSSWNAAPHLIATPLDALPMPEGKVALAGDTAVAVAARLAARDCGREMLTDARLRCCTPFAVAAERRLRGQLRPLPAQPLYVDPPEARLPAGGLRPPPTG